MACGGCGRSPKKNPNIDRRGNKTSSLSKYAFLKPNQLALLKAQEEKDNKSD